MGYSSLLNLPFIIAMILPALNMHKPDHSGGGFFLSDGFVYPVIILTTFFNGYGQGIAQPASGKFISDCATEKSKGFFFAYFWAFYMGSQVVGSFISGLLFSSETDKSPYLYVIIMTIILSLSVLLLFFLKLPQVAETNYLRERTDSIMISALPRHETPTPKPTKDINNSYNDESNRIIDQMLSESAKNIKLEEKPPLSIKDIAISMWNLFWKPRFLMLAPQCAWTGVSIAFFSGNLVEMMVSSHSNDDRNSEKALGDASFAMILFGAGEILGCFFIGAIVDRYGSYRASIANVCIMFVMGLITVIYAIVNKFNFLAFLMCFLWGFQDSAVNTHTQEILGFEFENNSEPFSVFNICQCIAMATFSLI